ncbi:MAG TPA: hypothetical protein VGJ00_04125 [Rhabdochlamydiaceae bacterium]|jgi:hypothetical protein
MDLNIEGTGEVSGWSPPIGEIFTPGFRALMSILDTDQQTVREFINKLEHKGYCIAKYEPENLT